jgi:hypothetical protein
MQSSDPWLARAAACSLLLVSGVDGQGDARARVLAALASDDDSAVDDALECIARLGERARPLVTAVGRVIARRPFECIGILTRLRPEGVEELARSIRRISDIQGLMAVVEALAEVEFRGTAAPTILRQCLGGEEGIAQVAAAVLLVGRGVDEDGLAAEVLRRALTTRGPAAGNAARLALTVRRGVIPIVAATAPELEPEVQRTTLAALRTADLPAATVQAILTGPDATDEIKAYAVHALDVTDRGAGDLVPMLIAAAGDGRGDPVLRAVAILKLGALGNPDAVPAIRAGLDDPDPMVRLHAGAALYRLVSDTAAMAEAMGDVDHAVRSAACEYLGDAGPTGAVPLQALRACLRDPCPDVRVAAIEAVPRLGDEAMSLREVVNDIARDEGEFEHVRSAARKAAAELDER